MVEHFGLSVEYFPKTGYFSSGIIFCSIGSVPYLEKDFLLNQWERGEQWEFIIRLGIWTGDSKYYLSTFYPQNILDQITKRSLFTVEGTVKKRNSFRNINKVKVSMEKELVDITYRHKYELLETALKNDGHATARVDF